MSMNAYPISLTLSFLVLGCAAPRSASFATPEEAVHRLMAAADDQAVAEQLLGPGGFAMLRSGDDVADHQDVENVATLIREKLAFEDVAPDRKLALLGKEGWELPIPLVAEAGGWRFDVESGREEILNRRVGRNELSTLSTMHALVEAQREYAAAGRDGNPPAYARRLISSDGKHDGLYWPVAAGEPESPLGPLVADASEEGYQQGSKPTPYHGYFYRLLTEQGPSAPGGKKGYVDPHEHLTGGFAVLAWPATYDNSGVMSFLVNQQGIVFEQDLGEHTEQAVARIQMYDPDASWTPTGD